MDKDLDRKRGASGVLIFAVWACLRFLIMPSGRDVSFRYLSFQGADKALFHHFLIVLEAMILFLIYLPFRQRNWIGPFSSKMNWLDTKLGILIGFLLFILTIPVAFYFGMSFSPHFSFVDAVGNSFSNAGEEFVYRGILFVSGISIFRKPYLAILISGIAFGAGHFDMPLVFQGYVAVVGMILGWSYLSKGSLAVPYVAHMVADVLLDSLFH